MRKATSYMSVPTLISTSPVHIYLDLTGLQPFPRYQLLSSVILGRKAKLLNVCRPILGEACYQHIHHLTYFRPELNWLVVSSNIILSPVSINKPYRSTLRVCYTRSQNIACSTAKMTENKVLKMLQIRARYRKFSPSVPRRTNVFVSKFMIELPMVLSGW